MKLDRPLFLALDTATRCSTVSLTRGTLAEGEVLACLSLGSNLTHSRRLINNIDYLFRQTETDWSEITGIAVGLGPGSFTGLRIGLATAKGFAAAAKIQLLGVATPDALAASAGCTGKRICAAIDARKKQVYAAYYRADETGRVQRIGDISALAPEEVVKEGDEPTLVVGDAIISYGELWRNQAGADVEFAPAHMYFPSAAAIGLIACQMHIDGESLDINDAVPLYIRMSDAELSLVSKNSN